MFHEFTQVKDFGCGEVRNYATGYDSRSLEQKRERHAPPSLFIPVSVSC